MMDTTSEEFFEGIYQRSSDPWGFSSSPYELARYEHVEALVSGRTYQCALEPGCSIGELTARLARHCRRLVAIEMSPTAVTRARARCSRFPQVEIRHGRLPEDIPAESFDLVVLSEIGYYFERAALGAVIGSLVSRMTEDGVLVAAHWTGESSDHVLSGYEVHEVLTGHPALGTSRSEECPGYLIGEWRRK